MKNTQPSEFSVIHLALWEGRRLCGRVLVSHVCILMRWWMKHFGLSRCAHCSTTHLFWSCTAPILYHLPHWVVHRSPVCDALVNTGFHLIMGRRAGRGAGMTPHSTMIKKTQHVLHPPFVLHLFGIRCLAWGGGLGKLATWTVHSAVDFLSRGGIPSQIVTGGRGALFGSGSSNMLGTISQKRV